MREGFLLYSPAASVAVPERPETLIARMFKEDLGIEINEQALRIFMRTRWSRLSPLAHAIHDGK